jgi:ASCH domain-containing protein
MVGPRAGRAYQAPSSASEVRAMPLRERTTVSAPTGLEGLRAASRLGAGGVSSVVNKRNSRVIVFQPEHVALILDGQKTQTRRLWARCRVRVGSVHACVARRFGAPFARVRVLSVRQEPLGAMSDDDAQRCGYQDRAAYHVAFERIYGTPTRDPLVWVVDFEVVP